MSRDVLTVGSTMRIALLYQGEYSQRSERTSSTEQPPLKDKSMCNKTTKDLWDALAKHMLGYEYEWKQYVTMMRQNKNLMDINIDALYNILKQNQIDVNDAIGLKKKTIVVTSDPLTLIAEKTKASKRKEKVVVSLDSEGSDADDFSELKKITAFDSDQEINANMVFMAQIEIVLSDSEGSSSSANDKISEKSENNCQVIEKVCDSEENPNVIAPGMFKLSVSQSVSPISMTRTSCASNSVENLDTLSSVRIPKPSGVMWMRKGSSNTIKADLSSVNHSNLNKNVKRYSRKNLMACNNSNTRSAFDCNNARNALCNAKMNASVDVNDLFIFDDVSIRKSHVSKMLFKKKPSTSLNVPSRSKLNKSLPRTIVQICLWIIDSGCSKHMTGNRALLTNFVEKFLGTVCFGNNDFAVIDGYGDVVIGSMTIKKVYYVDGLGHNLFSVGPYCDKGLEVSFRKSTCFVRTEDGVDLLAGDRSSNLYTIALNEVASNSLACLLVKVSSSQSWLWHQRLSYLNFATINNLVKNNLVQGLPKMKLEKNHLCFDCEQGKIHRKHHKSKMAFASNEPLYLLHMDLCGLMCVETINKKRYVLVVVDDYSWYTWVFFLHSKDEASEVIISFIKKTQVNPQLQVQRVRTDNDTEFKIKTLAKFFDELKAKCDIKVFVGYSKESAAFKIYNKQTRKIHESVNVNFDEITEMASKQFSLELGLSNLNDTRKSSNPSVSQVSETSKKDLQDLFQKIYDEYFDSSKIMKSSTTNVATSNVEIPSNEEEVFHESFESFQEESSSSSLNDDVHQNLEGGSFIEYSVNFK
nr:retrovirus-related Pol polyprotein from transposon TNT 1-94 [Tanacetum cinerariifolium]